MKYLLMLPLLFLLGCNYITPRQIHIAEQYCEPYGGWQAIRDSEDVICKLPNAITRNGSPISLYVSFDKAQIELWNRVSNN